MILNASFFGQLKIKYNNKILSPATDYVLSDLTDNKCWYEASKKECNRKDSEWFMNRKSKYNPTIGCHADYYMFYNLFVLICIIIC